uniref:Uncharacterized protein n=1 Tax=Knipowitschia caucasica TaxID=637954 RepID=A0AAV2LNB5_KNICA
MGSSTNFSLDLVPDVSPSGVTGPRIYHGTSGQKRLQMSPLVRTMALTWSPYLSTGTLQAAILCTCVLKHKDTTGSDPLYLCAVAQGHYRQRSSVPVCCKHRDTKGSDPLYLCAVAQGHYRQRSSVPVCCSTGTLQADPLYLCAVAQGHYRQILCTCVL